MGYMFCSPLHRLGDFTSIGSPLVLLQPIPVTVSGTPLLPPWTKVDDTPVESAKFPFRSWWDWAKRFLSLCFFWHTYGDVRHIGYYLSTLL
jgi:hypothetical protein